MELKVKAVPGPGEKSVQEVEEQLIEQNDKPVEEQVEETPTTEVAAGQPVEEQASETRELQEEDVLSYIKNRYEKDINSVDELLSQTESNEELPEDVLAFLKYKKETGRGIQDFMKIQKNYEDMDADQVLREYYSATESDLDDDDITYLMDDKFKFDEDEEDESVGKKKAIAKKRELAKAKKYFNELKETYKVPVESSASPVNEKELEDYNAYKKYVSESQSVQEQNQKRSEYFLKKTDELFNEEFKGFEFNFDDQKVVFNPGDVKSVKDSQSDINNFISKYLDKDGMITDANGYHKALSAALNPDKVAQFFYEKGKADAVDNVSKQSKNINMDVRNTPQQMSNTSGLKFRAVNPDSGRGLKIKKRS